MEGDDAQKRWKGTEVGREGHQTEREVERGRSGRERKEGTLVQ